MQRFLIAMLLSLGLVSIAGQTQAQYLKEVSGYLPAGRDMVFFPRTPGNSSTDTIYRISGTLSVAGRLVIRDGAEVHFLPNGRVVDSTGGKIIANGCSGDQRQILFRGTPINPNSVEWGHFLVLPGADSVLFANCRFENFRKGLTVDNKLVYGTTDIPGNPALTNSNAIIAQSNGVGAVMTSFSQRVWINNVIVDNCQAMFRAGAFAFLQAPLNSYFPNDDGRLALARSQVRRLTIRDTRALNTSGADPNTLGGAIYMAARPGATSASFVNTFLGNRPGFMNCDNLPSDDIIVLERCSAENTNKGPAQIAGGGAIYVGHQTSLTISQVTANSNSAIASEGDGNSFGGAIGVSVTSANPFFLFPPAPGFDKLPGLAVLKMATFNTNTAGRGGAIHAAFNANLGVAGPVVNIDAENINVSTSVRDSGMIQFLGNIAYLEGGAIYSGGYTYVTGYLAPIDGVLNQPDFRQIEGRVRFDHNVAGQAGGSVFLDPNSRAAIVNRRVWHTNNSVNPHDPRINRPTYSTLVRGGGAEYVGFSDSTFATEYHGNYTIGGNGGAVSINTGASGPGPFPINRYFGENKYNAQNVTISPLPFDPRELTRFCDNHAYLGPDSTALFTTRGRGGALHINITNQGSAPVASDSTFLSMVRIEQNYAFTGSAIYSNNYDLRVLANLSLIANNHATSPESANVDLAANSANPGDPNVGATIWGEFEGPLPSYESNSRGNAIYDNQARFLIRLPNGPLGSGGVDTVRGNFWGETGPDVITRLPSGALQRTFFIDFNDKCVTNVYEPNRFPPSSYTPIPVGDIADTLLMEGRVYDIFDRGTDIKTLDYNNRRMAPAEAFSLGLPTDLTRIRRFTRNIFSTDQTYIDRIMLMNTDFVGPHPIGYPLFLQAEVDANDINRDMCARNYTTLFVINTTTNEFVRVNAKETVQDLNAATHLYRGRLDFVPDSSIGTRNPLGRSRVLYTLSLLRPLVNSFAEIQRASKLEDSAALDGRRYTLDPAQLTGVGNDNVCVQGINGTTTWYAGERYRTLPVRPGDNILVISRTHLWKYGAAGAIARGLQFPIGDVLPPGFTSDVADLMSQGARDMADSVRFPFPHWELTRSFEPWNPNRLFLREDVSYAAAHGDPSVLLRVGGSDPNAFYDPRYHFDAGRYSQLKFEVTRQADSRLNSWLKDTLYFNETAGGSNGYVRLYGRPTNPDVVPGGEAVTVRVTNFPPNFESQQGLNLGGFDLGANGQQLSMWTFPPYMNCPSGFLSDTLCVRSTSSTYTFRIFVQDSLPLFLSSPETACAANLTDSLRYTYDINTDDEAEDDAARVEGWDFRYGQTSYSLLVRPQWLASQESDPNFRTKGLLNVRMSAAQALPLITPIPQINGELFLDTLIAVQADDGHAGKSIQKWRIPVNIEPKITTQSLPNAKEDFDYSFDFRFMDSVRRIQIFDENFADFHTFRLLYKGTTETIYRDERYQSGGRDIVGTTPAWLHIDPVSGVLYGTPASADAPRLSGDIGCGDPEVVTVVVRDACGLTAVGEFTIEVDSTNHKPSFNRGPRTICVLNKTQFCDTIRVVDRDLLRAFPGLAPGQDCLEQLSLNFLDMPAGAVFTLNPSTVPGTATSDTQLVAICGQFNEEADYFNQNPLPARYLTVEVTDKAGNKDTIRYQIHIGDQPTFECAVSVSNIETSTHPMDMAILCFGAGRFGGDSLDIRYCEFELPPPPLAPVFDSRWEYPIGGSIKGADIDIRRDNPGVLATWQIRMQSGNEGSTFLYPLRICWKPSCLEKTSPMDGQFYLRHPKSPEQFSINMRTGEGPIDNSLYTLQRVGSDSLCLEIRDIDLKNALIVYVPANSAVTPTPESATFALEQNRPNPFNPTTTLNFVVGEKSNVRIDIFDMKGSLVRTLIDETIDAGSYPVTWDATDANGAPVASGTYVAKMTAGTFTSSIKMTLNK